jgi:SOS-response transcriptional repressor LexA
MVEQEQILRFSPDKMFISGYVPCGKPLPMFEDGDNESLARFLNLNPSAVFCYGVRGNSMSGVGFHDGNAAIVDTKLTPKNGDIVLASINGDMTIKTLKLRNVRNVEKYTYQAVEALLAENPYYPHIYPNEGDNVTIYGVVVGGMWSGRRA